MLFAKVADGIADQGGCGLWSDVITTGGKWNSHRVTCFISAIVLDCCTEPHPICGADGICLCSCSKTRYKTHHVSKNCRTHQHYATFSVGK